MYTQKSVDLKSDFYSRFGEAKGRLVFEKVGVPCVILDGGVSAKLMFSLSCGVRAYGRGYGDVLRVLNSDTNVCDVHFVKLGKGAQILYKEDIPDLRGVREAAVYVINKLLWQIGSTGRLDADTGVTAICDKFAPEGWCAVKEYDVIKSAPMPISYYNVLLIRTRKTKLNCSDDMKKQFELGERERIALAYRALKECKIGAFFDILNESENSAERLLSPSDELLCAVEATRDAEGVCATKICDMGVICFVRKDRTDSATLYIHNECRRNLGYSARISVVK